MNILINFGIIKLGGGQNVALNFLQAFFELKINYNHYHFLVVKDSTIHKYLVKKNIKNINIVPHSAVARILWELFLSRKYLIQNDIKLIYTYYGYSIFPKNIPQISGIAVSNIFYPEIEFWIEEKGLNIILKKIIDKYRIWGLKQAHALIFENISMEKRAHKLFNISPSHTVFIKPAFIENYDENEIVLTNIPEDSFKILLLCGWQKHKNIMLVPKIAYELKNENTKYHFILTAPPDNSNNHIAFLKLADKYDVKNMISIFDQVEKSKLSSLYGQIDAVLLLSILESFSNTIIESWFFNKPLIVSDLEWAQAICKDAAIYVDRNDAKSIAKNIVTLHNNPVVRGKFIKEGMNMLAKYHSNIDRARQEIRFLGKIAREYYG